MTGMFGNQLREYLRDFNFLENVRDLHKNIRGDVLAGITVAMVVLPMALAFGVASGIGAIAGMWSAIAAGLIAGPLSGSAWSVGGPTGPMTIQLLNVLQTHRLPDGSPDLVFAFTTVALAGVILITLGVLKLGTFIKFTPYSVISGFMTGLGILYILLQLNPFFGLPGAKSMAAAVTGIPETLAQMNPAAVVIGSLTLAVGILWPRISPVTWLPGPLVGLVVGTGTTHLLGLQIPLIGDVPSGLPHLHIPDVTMLEAAFAPAAALAGLCIFDSLLTCLIIDNVTGTHHNSNRELIAQGGANLTSGLVGGIGGATNTMPCVVNIQSGARTRLAALTMGVVLFSLVLGLGPMASAIPLSALAGILIKAGYDILDMRVLPVVRRLPRSDMVVFVLVVLMTVFWNLLSAMALGLGVAFFRFVKDSADRYKQELAERDEEVREEESRMIAAYAKDHFREFQLPQSTAQPLAHGGNGELSEQLERLIQDRILIVRPHGPLFFGAVDWLQQAVEHLHGKDVLIIRCPWLQEIDLSGAYALGDLIEAAKRMGVTVLATGITPWTKKVLADLHELKRLGEDNIYDDFPSALDHALQIIRERAEEGKTELSLVASNGSHQPQPAAPNENRSSKAPS